MTNSLLGEVVQAGVALYVIDRLTGKRQRVIVKTVKPKKTVKRKTTKKCTKKRTKKCKR